MDAPSPSPAQGTRECPYCKETIRDDATRCKHCQSSVAPARPAHGGTCPYCKEAIKADAIRCKHCQASLMPGAEPQAEARLVPAAMPPFAGRFPAGPAHTGTMTMRARGSVPPADIDICVDGVMRCLDYCIIYADGRQICRYFDCGSCLG